MEAKNENDDDEDMEPGSEPRHGEADALEPEIKETHLTEPKPVETPLTDDKVESKADGEDVEES